MLSTIDASDFSMVCSIRAWVVSVRGRGYGIVYYGNFAAPVPLFPKVQDTMIHQLFEQYVVFHVAGDANPVFHIPPKIHEATSHCDA